MLRELDIPLFDMLGGLDTAMDLVSPLLVDHHKRVACVAASLAVALELPAAEQHTLLVAGMLHDIGTLSLRERLDCLDFEKTVPQEHAHRGFALIDGFEPFTGFAPFAGVAPLIRFHHMPWRDGEGASFRGEPVPPGAHILHLADRVAVLLGAGPVSAAQADLIGERIQAVSGSVFVPLLVEALLDLPDREEFLHAALSPSLDAILARWAGGMRVHLDLTGLSALARLFGEIIDFRSSFTATHSRGVAATAEALAGFSGLSETECRMMRIAGYLHDLGKLAVPVELLEKQGPLSEEEFAVVRSHSSHTYRILEGIPGMETINAWGAFHHERLDGAGYPFHRNAAGLPLGSRIVAVADTFTAVTEDRPYRLGMSADKAVTLLQKMAAEKALDARVVDTLVANFDAVNGVREAAQAAAAGEFLQFSRTG
jgi:HD-GYP domain-containing protein (c-di-GMP phosphodiesterase class II)